MAQGWFRRDNMMRVTPARLVSLSPTCVIFLIPVCYCRISVLCTPPFCLLLMCVCPSTVFFVSTTVMSTSDMCVLLSQPDKRIALSCPRPSVAAAAAALAVPSPASAATRSQRVRKSCLARSLADSPSHLAN